MRNSVLSLALLACVFVSASASAQTDRTPRGEPVFAEQNYMLLERFPEYQACSLGNVTECYLVQFGDCADDNPRVAIPACTRHLALQDNRRRLVDQRFERAVRYLLRANAHMNEGNLDRGLADLDRAVRADGRIFWIHAIRGDAYFLSGIYDEALESYDRALRIEEDEASARSNRALILAAAPDEELRNAPQALEDAQLVNELVPDQPAYIDVLAIAYAANGYFDMAEEEEERAMDLLPREDQGRWQSYRQRLRLFQNDLVYAMPAASEG